MSVYQPQVLYLEMRTALCAKILIIPEPWQKMHCLAKSPNVMIKTPIKALQVGSLTGRWMAAQITIVATHNRDLRDSHEYRKFFQNICSNE